MPSRQHLDNKSSQESAALPLVLPILYCLVSRGKRSKGNMLPRVWRQGDDKCDQGQTSIKGKVSLRVEGSLEAHFFLMEPLQLLTVPDPTLSREQAWEWVTHGQGCSSTFIPASRLGCQIPRHISHTETKIFPLDLYHCEIGISIFL